MDFAKQDTTASQPSPTSPGDENPPRIIRSEEIFQGGREVRIEHEDSVYRLRLTRKGKLILHKRTCACLVTASWTEQ